MSTSSRLCLFCRRWFDSLPWYGCCLGCYTLKDSVRQIVDAAHRKTTDADRIPLIVVDPS